MSNAKNMVLGKSAPPGRRRFLKHVLVAGGATGVAAAGGLSALSRLAAQTGPSADEKFYVYAYFSGGWDTLLGIDPRDPAVFNADSVGQTRIMPGYENQAAVEFQEAPRMAPGTEILLGPAARPLEAIADRLVVIRGMSMDTLTHEVGRRRFLTGKPPSGLNARGSSGSCWLSAQFDTESRLIPNLSVGVESFNPSLPPDVSALRVGSSTDLVAMLRRRDPLMDPMMDESIAQLLADESSCARSVSSPVLRTSESARLRMHAVLDADVQALFDFRNDMAPGIPELRDHFGFTTSTLTSGGAQAAIAYQAITQGVSRVVSFQAAGGLDTHFDDWEDVAGPRQREGWQAIVDLATLLGDTEFGSTGTSYLDRTVIVGFSEFMRTPLLNARGGRDHWLTGSCAVIGGNIRGGNVIGASSDVGMSPQLVDIQTGRVTEDSTVGQIIRPEHVLRTLLVDAGLEEDRADLRVPPMPALIPA
ncbi:MAG: DUF1501 domain-containing protein [Sandaracinaceae bacterium]